MDKTTIVALVLLGLNNPKSRDIVQTRLEPERFQLQRQEVGKQWQDVVELPQKDIETQASLCSNVANMHTLGEIQKILTRCLC